MEARRFKLPFFFIASFSFVAFYLSVALYIALIPLMFLHRLVVCVLGWFLFATHGKRVLIVHTGTEHSAKWMSRSHPLAEGRETLLDYDDRKNWRYWSFAVQLFHAFGPMAIPQFFIRHALPAVILTEKFKWPKMFAFGNSAREPEAKWEQLQSALR